MKTTAALAAPPSRAPSLPADGGGDGSFAATLDLAREPAKAALDRPAKPQAGTPSPPTPKAPAKTASNAPNEAGRSPKTRADEATDTAVADEASAVQDAVLPGWPPLSPPSDAATSALPAAAADAETLTGADADLDTLLASSAGSLDMTRPALGKPRAAHPSLGGPMAQPAHAIAAGLPLNAELLATPAQAASAATASAALGLPVADTLPPPTAPWLAATAPVASAPAATPAAAPGPAHAFAAHLAAAIDSPAFAPALATQVSWLVQEGVQLARLTLNPAEMGPVAVRIMLDGTQARVDFSAALASTRAAIESSLPTLAAALHESGMTLAGGGVSDGQTRSGAHGEPTRQATGHTGAAATTDAGDGSFAWAPRAARGLVDLVA